MVRGREPEKGRILHRTGGHFRTLWLKYGIKWNAGGPNGCPVRLLSSPGRMWELRKDCRVQEGRQFYVEDMEL